MQDIDSNAHISVFISILYIRVTMGREMELVEWLQSLQVMQANISTYQYSSLTQIQQWIGRDKVTKENNDELY